jgi:hypothetical protein
VISFIPDGDYHTYSPQYVAGTLYYEGLLSWRGANLCLPTPEYKHKLIQKVPGETIEILSHETSSYHLYIFNGINTDVKIIAGDYVVTDTDPHAEWLDHVRNG